MLDILTKPSTHLHAPEGPTSSLARLHLTTWTGAGAGAGWTGVGAGWTGAGAGAFTCQYLEYLGTVADWTAIVRAARAIANFILSLSLFMIIDLAFPFFDLSSFFTGSINKVLN